MNTAKEGKGQPSPVATGGHCPVSCGTDSLSKIESDLRNCPKRECHAAESLIVFGEGNCDANIVLVGEKLGENEVIQKKPFAGGRAGEVLDEVMNDVGMDRESVYITNVIKCRLPEDRRPRSGEIADFKPFLLREINTINPCVVVCLGWVAASTLLKTKRPLYSLREDPPENGGRPFVVTYNPAARVGNLKQHLRQDLREAMRIANTGGNQSS